MNILAGEDLKLSFQNGYLQDFSLSLESLERNMDKFFLLNYQENTNEVNKDIEQLHSTLISLNNNADKEQMALLVEMESILSEIEANFNNLANSDRNKINPEKLNEKGILIYQLINNERQKNRELILDTSNKTHLNVMEHHMLMSDIVSRFLIMSISVLISGILLSVITSRSISHPIKKLMEATSEIGQGRFNIDIPIRSNDEVGQLGLAFNKMTGELQKTTVSKDYVENIIQSMFDALIVTSKDGTIQTVNKAICDMLGYRIEELIGKSVDMLFSEKNSNPGCSCLDRSAKECFNINTEKTCYSKDGREIPVLLSISSMCDGKGNNIGIVFVARDITEQKRAEDKLNKSRKFADTVINSMNDAISVIDVHDFKIVDANSVFLREYGIRKEEAVGKTCFEISHKYDRPCNPEDDTCPLMETLNTGKHSRAEHRHLMKEEEKRYVEIMTSPILDERGKIINVIHVARDITDRKQIEVKLKQASVYNRSLIEASLDPLVTIDARGKITDVNTATENVTGYQRQQLIGTDFSDYFTEPDKARDVYKQVFEKEYIRNYPLAISHRSSKVTDVLYNATIYKNEAGEVQGVFASARDITEQRRAEEKIKKSLEEKETLLKEIHHRVKNNLQIVSSLLDHQTQFIKDQDVIDIFTESQNRIISMSLVHEKLYQSKDLSRINFDTYVYDLVAGLFQSYEVNHGKVALNLVIENIQLDIDSAIPCGLIINELATNTLKYAFPADRKGEFRILFQRIDGDMLELIVGDNGIGLPGDLDFRKASSLGLHLVTILAENQLHGEIKLNRNNGTEFQIKFRGIKR